MLDWLESRPTNTFSQSHNNRMRNLPLKTLKLALALKLVITNKLNLVMTIFFYNLLILQTTFSVKLVKICELFKKAIMVKVVDSLHFQVQKSYTWVDGFNIDFKHYAFQIKTFYFCCFLIGISFFVSKKVVLNILFQICQNRFCPNSHFVLIVFVLIVTKAQACVG